MILTKNLEITLNPANMKHFSNLGYKNLKPKNKLIIPVEHLNSGSHSIIKVKCDVCGCEKDLMYRFYLKSVKKFGFYCCSSKCGQVKLENGVVNYSQTNEYKEKFKKTCMSKYGFNNPSQIEKFKDKRKQTMLDRHGVEYYVLSDDFSAKSEKTSIKNYGTAHPMMSEKMKEIKKKYYISKGFNITTDEFELYKNKVYLLTKKIKNVFLLSWDGKDFYDGENIKDNFNLPYHHKNYPTIDHKTSIFEGFKNNTPIEQIADISNLCLTKRCINSRKYIKTELTFFL
jgi:hypothetical protein